MHDGWEDILARLAGGQVDYWRERLGMAEDLMDALQTGQIIEPQSVVCQLLLRLADDPKWEVRKVVANGLNLVDDGVFDDLAARLLSDSNGFVKRSAEQSFRLRRRDHRQARKREATDRQLVVEDDLEIQEEIEDVLGLLDHDYDWAGSQQEARELIERNAYHYVLADLEIPARPGRGFAKIEYGKRLIEQVQQIKGRGTIPVIVMTGHPQHGLNLARQLQSSGVMDFVSKPFGDGTSGKSLPQAIQGVLEQHRKTFPPGVLPGDPPRPFRGGILAFYPDCIELERKTILERGGPGHGWAVMQTLRTPRHDGRRSRLSAPKLAKAVDPSGQTSDGAINSCIHTLRSSISGTMLAEANLTVGRDDVIANKGRGYHLADWIIIEEHDECPQTARGQDTLQGPCGDIRPDVPASGDDAPLTDRQRWVLDRLRAGAALTRNMVEAEFKIGSKQAKRMLTPLVKRGLIEFVRRPWPGHYVLRIRLDHTVDCRERK